MKQTLFDKLKAYNKTHIPMHMPGHKRNSDMLSSRLPYDIDITEIDGFDNLHDMQGVLKDTADLASTLYGAGASFPLTGGSTCGILAAMHTLTTYGDHVLISRNSHQSVYHGIDLLGLIPHYLTAKADENGIAGTIDPVQVEQALLNNSRIRLVVITSPTYEGVVRNVAEIADICHKHGALLLVDAAHGAHLGFSEDFPENPVACAADAVVMSLHKTMPCLTQTALLHICTEHVDTQKIAESLRMFETSSPSYVLLSSIDEGLRFVAEKKDTIFSAWSAYLEKFYANTKALAHLRVFHYEDKSKIIISTKHTSLCGKDLAERLRNEFFIETEMTCANYVLAMTSMCDTEEHFASLEHALKTIDASITDEAEPPICDTAYVLPKQVCSPKEARKETGAFVALSDSAGHICLEYIWAYPPGIPMIVPGEEIPETFPDTLKVLMQKGVEIKSTKGNLLKHQIYTKKQ